MKPFEPTDDRPIRVEVDGGTATLTMWRPEVRNALNAPMRSAVRKTLAELDADPSVRAIILTGADPAFCAGLDLKELAAGENSGLSAGDDSTGPWAPLSKPLIGAINGVAVTGGFEYALACDFLMASEHARFADTHARVGIMPGWGLSVQLPRAIGVRRARQMSLTGNYIDAGTALEWGLVNEVVPHAELLPRCLQLAADVGEIDASTITAYRQLYVDTEARTEPDAMAYEITHSRAWRQGEFSNEDLAAKREAIQARGRAQ